MAKLEIITGAFSQEINTILAIDDSPTNLEVLHETLESAGYEVIVEMDGISGIEQVKNNPPALILLDIMMPGIDGFETCRRLQADPSTKNIPIIFMTALTDTVEKVRGLSLGAVDYITKPFEKNEVLARIEVQLKLRRLQLELEQQKQILEQRVKERTAELYEALETLQKTQLHLVQVDKVSTLGQLITGIAYEINNPVGLISTNLYYANNYVQDLINLVNIYGKIFPHSEAEIEEKIQAMDLEHIISDLPKLISSMKLGSDRIQGIMESLRYYCRADGVRKKPVDIHEGLETTIMILQHRLKAQPKRPTIHVIKEYGNIPRVECYPGQINQVFMNLLTNAIDVFEEMDHKSKIKNPQIRIFTTADKEQLIIKIADNGIGMSESVQSQIFNSFFTTKLEAEAAGLGLSLSYQIIVENHGGTLKCFSSPGEGTEFVMTIPLL